MQIVINQESLNAALNVVARAVSTKNTIPVLSGIHFSVLGDRLILRATDMELSIESTIPCKSLQNGEIVLPARFLTDLIRRIPFGDIDLIVDERNFTATVKWGKSQYVMHGYSPSQFPSMPSPEDASPIAVSQSGLKDLLRQTTFASGNDETKPWLTGVLFRLRDNLLLGTATDGVRIAYAETETTNVTSQNFSVIVPSRSLNELVRLLSGSQDQYANVSVTSNQIFFDIGNTRIISRLLEGQYPDVMRLVPQAYPTEITIQKSNFIEALERASLIAKDGAVRISLNDAKVTITSNTPEIGQVYEEIPASSLEGDALEMGFNSKFLMEYLKTIDDQEFRFQCSGSRNPAKLQPAHSTNSIYVILPLITA